MSLHEPVRENPGLGPLVAVRLATVDDLSNIRYIHLRAFERLASIYTTEEEQLAFSAFVKSTRYADELFKSEVIVGLVEGKPVATAAWQASDDTGDAARISAVFVEPTFAGAGVGRKLMADIESRAAQSGFTRFALRSTTYAVPFFLRLGYEIASRGVSADGVASGVIPVTFMRKSIAQAVGSLQR